MVTAVKWARANQRRNRLSLMALTRYDKSCRMLRLCCPVSGYYLRRIQSSGIGGPVLWCVIWLGQQITVRDHHFWLGCVKSGGRDAALPAYLPPPFPRQTPQDPPLLGKDELAPASGWTLEFYSYYWEAGIGNSSNTDRKTPTSTMKSSGTVCLTGCLLTCCLSTLTDKRSRPAECS